MTNQGKPHDGLTEAQKNYDSDRVRIRTRKAALLALLRDRNWHPNYELADVGGLSFNSYLYQLRLAGWEIVSRRIRGGVWEQRLIGRGTVLRSRDGLSGPQQQVADEFTAAVQKVYGREGLNRIRRELSPRLSDSVAV
jgi:hypothetical protein